MRYNEYRDSIAKTLRQNPRGLTWAELQQRLALPYDRPCPNWTSQLEKEIGLKRDKSAGRALIWRVGKTIT